MKNSLKKNVFYRALEVFQMIDSGNISEMKSLASDDEEEDAENARLEGR